MSNDKVTPSKRRAPRKKSEISFGGSGEGPGALIIWQGLRGVCREMDMIETDGVNRYIGLAAAAAVLSQLLEDRML
jgi:hypothetical protein